MQNYRVAPGHKMYLSNQWFEAGAVQSEWFWNKDAGLAGRIATGALVPTDEPTNIEVPRGEAKLVEDPLPSMIAEVDRLKREVSGFSASNRELVGRAEELAAANKRLTESLGRLTNENGHLSEACKTHQDAREALERQVAELTAQLEVATAPKKKAAA